MIWIFLLIFCSVLGFSFYSRKFSNPNKLIFIFGKKGSGKSTYMVKLMLQHYKKGWTIYTNMTDVLLPNVRFFSLEDLKTKTPDPHSVVFVDEGGLLWDNRNYKNFDAGYTEWFKLQRKYQCKVYINSQAFDVDLKIRNLTDSMILQSNIGNVIGVGRPIVRTVKLTDPSADHDSRIADCLRFDRIWRWKFTWLPRYFKYFDSFEAPHRDPVPFSVSPCEHLPFRSRPSWASLNRFLLKHIKRIK